MSSLPLLKIRSGVLVVASLLVFVQSGFGQDDFAKDAAHFDYDRLAPLDVKELSVEDRGGGSVHTLTYASPGGTVPAYLVVPKGQGKFAAILWAHWLMPKASNANKNEFLDE